MKKCDTFANESQVEGHISDISDFKWKQTESMNVRNKNKSIQSFQANKNTINDHHMWVESVTFLRQGYESIWGRKRHLVWAVFLFIFYLHNNLSKATKV